jgi:hypothetical protein
MKIRQKILQSSRLPEYFFIFYFILFYFTNPVRYGKYSPHVDQSESRKSASQVIIISIFPFLFCVFAFALFTVFLCCIRGISVKYYMQLFDLRQIIVRTVCRKTLK